MSILKVPHPAACYSKTKKKGGFSERQNFLCLSLGRIPYPNQSTYVVSCPDIGDPDATNSDLPPGPQTAAKYETL